MGPIEKVCLAPFVKEDPNALDGTLKGPYAPGASRFDIVSESLRISTLLPLDTFICLHATTIKNIVVTHLDKQASYAYVCTMKLYYGDIKVKK